MEQVKAFIEKGDDGTYGIYIDLEEDFLTYTIIGDGATIEEAIEDFYNSYEDMREYYRDVNKYFQEVEFTIHYDQDYRWTKEELSVVPGMSMAAAL